MDANRAQTSLAIPEAEASMREQQLSDNLMSPFCPGRTLFSCPSEEAGKLRREIHSLFSTGKSREEIESLLTKRYGEDIRGMPRAEGIGVFAWVVPLGFVLLVALLLLRMMRQGPSLPEGAPPKTGDID